MLGPRGCDFSPIPTPRDDPVTPRDNGHMEPPKPVTGRDADVSLFVAIWPAARSSPDTIGSEPWLLISGCLGPRNLGEDARSRHGWSEEG